MYAESSSHTGLEIIDSLQGLQKIVDNINDPDAKFDRARKGVGWLGAGILLDHQFIVSSAQVFGKDPDTSPRERVLFNDGMFFIATLSSYGYLLDKDIPVDCLSLNFIDPEIIGADERDARLFRLLMLQVPVLAIDSCSSAEAA